MSRHIYHNPSRVIVDDGPGGVIALAAGAVAVAAVAAAASWLLANLLLAVGIFAGVLAVAAAGAAGYVALVRVTARVMEPLTVVAGRSRLHPALPAPPAAIAAPVREPLAIEAPKPVLTDIAVTAEVRTVKEERQHA